MHINVFSRSTSLPRGVLHNACSVSGSTGVRNNRRPGYQVAFGTISLLGEIFAHHTAEIFNHLVRIANNFFYRESFSDFVVELSSTFSHAFNVLILD